MSVPKLTVAIPTMKRWHTFLYQSLPLYLNCKDIDYVVICDETGEDVDAIRATEWATHPKLRLYKNKTRLGVYYNKRNAFEKAPTDWVAVLDSDNYFQETYFSNLKQLIQEQEDATKIVYAAGGMIRFYTDGSGKPNEDKLAGFRGLMIDKTNWNMILNIEGWNYLLNDGNWMAHKSLLNILPDDVDDKNIGGTDSIYIARKAVASGFTYWVVPELSYIHTVHSQSHWIQTAEESSRLLMTRDWRI
jgi:glycosyltransferase involved in cell wall biosynthesis